MSNPPLTAPKSRGRSVPIEGVLTMDVGFEDILRFWFPPALETADIATQARRIEWWFRGGANSETADRFVEVLNRAARGEHDDWSAAPRSRLALILVLDLFPRSLYPNSAKAYAQDPIRRSRSHWRRFASDTTPRSKTRRRANVLLLAPRPLGSARASRNRGGTGRGDRASDAGDVATVVRAFRVASAWPPRHGREVRPSAPSERDPRSRVDPRRTRVSRQGRVRAPTRFARGTS